MAFFEPAPIPLALKKMLRLEETELSRAQVTAHLYEYCKSHFMIRGAYIIPNNRFRAVFDLGEDERIEIATLQQRVEKVYEKKVFAGKEL